MSHCQGHMTYYGPHMTEAVEPAYALWGRIETRDQLQIIKEQKKCAQLWGSLVQSTQGHRDPFADLSTHAPPRPWASPGPMGRHSKGLAMPALPQFLLQSTAEPSRLMVNVSGRLTSAGLPRLDLSTGTFAVPNHVDRVLIDVGTYECSEFYQQIRSEWSDSHPWMRNALVLAFEPTLSSYETHMRKCAHPQLWLFPAGVAETEGTLLIHESRYPGCNTLSPEGFAGIKGKLGKANRICSVDVQGRAGARGSARVPVLPLSLIMSLLPAAMPVSVLKIDAQGLELQVRSARRAFCARRAAPSPASRWWCPRMRTRRLSPSATDSFPRTE